ncbi:MAG: diguanylate cyclase [Bryobacteraceae bacterium]|nr:diguanylate cyclase [Bryobacteraceae bacterium]
MTAAAQPGTSLPTRSLVFQAYFIVAALASLPSVVVGPPADSWLAVGTWLLLTALVAWLRVGFPSPAGVFSVEWVCVLVVMVGHGVKAALVVAVIATIVKAWRQSQSGECELVSVETAFRAALGALAVQAGSAAFELVTGGESGKGLAAGLPVAALAMFACVQLPRAAAASLAERTRMLTVWRERALWSVPYHLAGAALAGLLLAVEPSQVWLVAAFGMPLFVLLSRAFQAHLMKVEVVQRQAKEVTALQKEMLEALALAVEARESGGRPNLHRIGVTARLLGESLELSEDELKALDLAALLHDIGKLAVPDYILSKPGRLEPEELERLRLHPVVGAEIVERARFPYPVAPLIRAHHERWDGAGYPDGIAGEQIPLGARVLAVVDALDGLMSERKYRRALPLRQAVEVILREAGAAYDPEVVEALRGHYKELEILLQVGNHQPPNSLEFVHAVNDAHREEQQIQELIRQLDSSFDIGHIVKSLEERLPMILPFHSAALWLERDGRLHATLALGAGSKHLLGAVLPRGEGVSGRAAMRRRAIVNAPAAAELALLDSTPEGFPRGQTALAVPFVSDQGALGVFTVYGSGAAPFEGRHARLAAAFAPRLASWLDSAKKYQQAEELATQDALTGLPNAAALYLHLQQEIARNARAGKRLAVLVCDLDGFKAVNDTYGHLAGNEVLQAVAAGLRERCREYDFVARMGGDEFVILLPGIGEEPIHDRVHSFGLAVIEAGRKVCGHSAVSLSIGVAFSPADGVTPDELLARADERMYANKRMHKSRTLVPADTAHAIYPLV